MADLPFSTVRAETQPIDPAPDGSEVRPLLRLRGGSMARFRLTAGAVTRAVRHRTVEELWYVVHGRGELWRRQGAHSDVVALEAGVAVSIPVGTDFQFRADTQQDLTIVAVTMPPWPDAEEAEIIEGIWPAP